MTIIDFEEHKKAVPNMDEQSEIVDYIPDYSVEEFVKDLAKEIEENGMKNSGLYDYEHDFREKNYSDMPANDEGATELIEYANLHDEILTAFKQKTSSEKELGAVRKAMARIKKQKLEEEQSPT